ncbi:MAG: geranylgeranylglyceryl/heptaprenylglyceryl phosphate synthase [Flavobacteriales bacterium]|nr:geranylgeranylglyceryl/heptaprenylglyceryl phosphate synthase [Flavobacteriales bacterium]MCB9174347.1 geranylgeranylglyceryl/heptaprenylglyceryl phosphate synthase [Flavobacteriales bacterium]
MTKKNIYKGLLDKSAENKKMFSVLIDPDKQNFADLHKTVSKCNDAQIDFFLVGGSIITKGDIATTVRFIKENSKIPVVLFPGNHQHVTQHADGILFLSLISGRNPSFLIGNQVLAAPIIQKTDLEVLSTGYMLVDCGTTTTAIYMSETAPLPYHKPDIAAATALAGEYLGLKMIYIDGGSGAQKTISTEMIKQVKSVLSIPLIIGGGIKSAMQANDIYQAGADIIIIGNGAEENRSLIQEIADVRASYNLFSIKN